MEEVRRLTAEYKQLHADYENRANNKTKLDELRQKISVMERELLKAKCPDCGRNDFKGNVLEMTDHLNKAHARKWEQSLRLANLAHNLDDSDGVENQ